MAFGFYETSRNGHRSIAHNGGTQFFHSDLHLLVDDGVGIFISLNSSGDDAAATGIHNALFDGFMDRYFPALAIAPAESPASPQTDDMERQPPDIGILAPVDGQPVRAGAACLLP